MIDIKKFFKELEVAVLKQPPINTKWVAFTGGPSAGKSTILRMLGKKGYKVEEEKARNYLTKELEKGRPLEEIIYDKVFLVKEILIQNLESQKKLPISQQIIFDRAAPDVLAFCLTDNVDPMNIFHQCISFRFEKVFIFNTLRKRKDGTIYHTYEQRRKIASYCRRIYNILSPEVVTVPKFTHDEAMSTMLCADFIEKSIKTDY